MKASNSKADKLHQLHKQGFFREFCAWDVVSARVFEAAGFPAIGTTSAGIGLSLGQADSKAVSKREMLAAIESICSAVSIPVTADIEAGYGETPAEVADTVAALIEIGAAGFNLEDNSSGPGSPLVPIAKQVERLRAVRKVLDDSGIRLFFNSRTDVFWIKDGVSVEQKTQEAIKRGRAYMEAGADGFFASGDVTDAKAIAALAREVPGPLSLLASAGTPPVSELERLGVRRLMLGSGPMRATMGLLTKIAEEYRDRGTYELMQSYAMPLKDIRSVLSASSKADVN